VLIDVSAKASAEPDYRLSMEDVRSWEKRHGTIPSGAIVLLRTGWAKRWPDRKQYLGDDTPGDASKLHFPSFGKESAEYLVGQRHVGALGLDTASIDVGASKDFTVHRITERGRRRGAGEPRQPRSGPGGGRLGHRPADEDRRWIGRSPSRCCARFGGDRSALIHDTPAPWNWWPAAVRRPTRLSGSVRGRGRVEEEPVEPGEDPHRGCHDQQQETFPGSPSAPSKERAAL
jgi:hypothetical protein